MGEESKFVVSLGPAYSAAVAFFFLSHKIMQIPSTDQRPSHLQPGSCESEFFLDCQIRPPKYIIFEFKKMLPRYNFLAQPASPMIPPLSGISTYCLYPFRQERQERKICNVWIHACIYCKFQVSALIPYIPFLQEIHKNQHII